MARKVNNAKATVEERMDVFERRLDAYDARFDKFESSLDRIEAKLNAREAEVAKKQPNTKKNKGTSKKSTSKPANTKKSTSKVVSETSKIKKNATPKKDKADTPNLRCTKAESLKLMVDSWHNRAAKAYAVAKGFENANSYKWDMLDSKSRKSITAAQKDKAKEDLLNSSKWNKAVTNHGHKESDLKW